MKIVSSWTQPFFLFVVWSLVLINPLPDLFAQDIIWEEDFETCGNTENCGGTRYTSVNDFHDGTTDDDYFGRGQSI